MEFPWRSNYSVEVVIAVASTNPLIGMLEGTRFVREDARLWMDWFSCTADLFRVLLNRRVES
jgi:hypothetical protein